MYEVRGFYLASIALFKLWLWIATKSALLQGLKRRKMVFPNMKLFLQEVSNFAEE